MNNECRILNIYRQIKLYLYFKCFVTGLTQLVLILAFCVVLLDIYEHGSVKDKFSERINTIIQSR